MHQISFKYIIKNLIMNIRTNLFLLFLYALSFSLLISVYTINADFTYKERSERESMFGNQDAIILAPQSGFNAVLRAEPNVQKAGTIQTFFTDFKFTDMPFDYDMVLGTFDQDALDINSITLLEGRMPENSGEVVAEKITLLKYRPGYQMGDVLHIAAQNPSVDEGGEDITMRLVLVGVVETYSTVHGMSQTNPQGNFSLPNLILHNGDKIVYEAFGQAKTDAFFTTYYHPLILNKGTDAGLYLQTLSNKHSTSFILNNYEYLKDNHIYQAKQHYNYFIVISSCIILLLTILSTFIYTMKKTEKKIGLLKIAGATNGYIARIMLAQNTILFAVSLLLAAAALRIVYALIFSVLKYTIDVTIVSGYLLLLLLLYMAAINTFGIVSLFHKGKNNILSSVKLYDKSKAGQPDSVRVKTNNPLLLWSVKNFIKNKSETFVSCLGVMLSLWVFS